MRSPVRYRARIGMKVERMAMIDVGERAPALEGEVERAVRGVDWHLRPIRWVRVRC